MSDLIKREDAIKAVKRVSENYTGKGKRDYHPHVDFIVDELKYCVPSADLNAEFAEWAKLWFKEELEAGRPQDDDWEKYSDKLWKNAYERGKEEEHRWWSEHCAKCTDANRPQGEWIKDNLGTVICSECKRPRRDNRVNHINFCNSCGARMRGADDESTL